MIALNVLLMATVLIAIVALLAWAIASDRRGHRTAEAELPQVAAAAPTPRAQNQPAGHGARTHRTGHTSTHTPTRHTQPSAA